MCGRQIQPSVVAASWSPGTIWFRNHVEAKAVLGPTPLINSNAWARTIT